MKAVTGPVLITGSEGRIGRLMARGLRTRGLDVRTFDAVPGADAIGDVRDLAALRAAARGVRSIVHLAGIAYDAPGRTGEVLDVNVGGTWNVLLAAEEAGVSRVVVASSIQALGIISAGPPRRLPFDDGFPACPRDGYEISKHLVEELCRLFTEQRGLSTVCLRPTLVTHPELWYDGRPSADADRSAFDEESQRRIAELFSYIDAEDLTDAVTLALAARLGGFHALLIAAADTHVTTPTADLLARHYPGVPFEFRPGSAIDPDDPYHALIDCREAARVLGWRARIRRSRPAAAEVGT
ncbi:NAD-dependent epimerase/dehydratase family protein [Nonomuraea sp. MTCD27]|uniref:NAD-dependent epimerase/dehydratase family protein n=1 Tax=Nonomuraea sp. MTCD27 TaxID=1676747 RepID=UPI0035C1BF20